MIAQAMIRTLWPDSLAHQPAEQRVKDQASRSAPLQTAPASA